MGEISDKIRKWCGTCRDSCIDEDDCDGLRDLADRIDAEMVELPKDADGVPIHVGDTVWGCISGMQTAVHELRLTDRWTISTDMGFAPKASVVTHARPDSFERIADELEAKTPSCGHQGYIVVSRDEVIQIADRIRKLAKKEGG